MRTTLPARRLLAAALTLAALSATPAVADAAIEPSTGHPRILFRAQDLPELRSRAVASNGFWQRLDQQGRRAIQNLTDANAFTGPEKGAQAAPPAPARDACVGCESYAPLLSFLALVSPDDPGTPADERVVYAQHSRDVLMRMVDEIGVCIDKRTGVDNPGLCNGTLLHDRGRRVGYGLPMAVDQLQGFDEEFGTDIITSADLAKVRTAFRFLSELIVRRSGAPNYGPPMSPLNDPSILANGRGRWSGNNHWAGRMRNLVFMSLALDAADDQPSSEPFVWNQPYQEASGSYLYPTLRGYLASVWGSWLYSVAESYKTDIRGGIFPEGAYYGSSTGAFVVQSLVALQTAGQSDPAQWGPNATFIENRFFDDMVDGYLHQLPNTSEETADWGRMWEPALHGDVDNRFEMVDFILSFGALGLYDQITGDDARLSKLRYIQKELTRGGPDRFYTRLVTNPDDYKLYWTNPLVGFLYLSLYDDPTANEPDPRPATPTSLFSGGLNRLYSRTGWGPGDSLFTFGLSWNNVEHTRADGNDFGLWRQGEWLTRQRNAYANADTTQHNGMAIQNDAPISASMWRTAIHERGSQAVSYLTGQAQSDPVLVARSQDAAYDALTGDATGMYNVPVQGMDDVQEATRSIVWLKPDHVIVYDRVRTATAGRFKRFWLQLTSTDATIAGHRLTMTTEGGQKLFVTSLAPQARELTLQPVDPGPVNAQGAPLAWYPVQLDPVKQRLRIEATGGPADTRFLTVLQGAGAGASADETTRVESSGGDAFEGTVVGDHVVLFPRSLQAAQGTTYDVPAGERRHLVTGLQAGGRYAVTETTLPSGRTRIVVAPVASGGRVADEGGVLAFDAGALSGPAAATLSETTVDFGAVRARTASEPRAVTVTNTGGEPLRIDRVRRAGTGNSLFAVADDTCTGATVAPGGSCSFGVTFAPLVPGAWSPRILMEGGAPTATVALSGTGVRAGIGVSAPALDFGVVPTGTVAAPQPVTVTNTGTEALLVDRVRRAGTGGSLFALHEDTCTGATLAPGATCALAVTFAPLAAGAWAPSLVIEGNGLAESIALSGSGARAGATATPAALDFGSVARRTVSAPQALTIANDGGLPTTISRIRRAGTGGSLFTLADDTCTGATLAPGETCTVQVAFAPLAVGGWTPALVVEGTARTVTVPLSGQGD